MTYNNLLAEFVAKKDVFCMIYINKYVFFVLLQPKIKESMKLKYLLIPLFAMMLLLAACHDNPKQSCRKFLHAYFVGNFSEAQQYATPETKEMLILLNQHFTQGMDTAEVNRIKNANLQIKSIHNGRVSDSTVVLFCKFHIDNKLDSTRVLMVKEKGRWLVKFPYTDR